MTLNACTCAVTKLLEATALCVCRPDALDGALRRPGRFDRELLFPLPNVEARASILEIHTRGWAQPPAPELRAQLAGTTAGYCGADLKVLQGARPALVVLPAVFRTSADADSHTRPQEPG